MLVDIMILVSLNQHSLVFGFFLISTILMLENSQITSSQIIFTLFNCREREDFQVWKAIQVCLDFQVQKGLQGLGDKRYVSGCQPVILEA